MHDIYLLLEYFEDKRNVILYNHKFNRT